MIFWIVLCIVALVIFYILYNNSLETFNDLFEIQNTNKLVFKNFQSVPITSLNIENIQNGYINKYLMNDTTITFDIVGNIFGIIGDSADLPDAVNPNANYNVYISDAVDQSNLPTGNVKLLGQLHMVHQGGYQLHTQFEDATLDNLRFITLMLENSTSRLPILRGQFS